MSQLMYIGALIILSYLVCWQSYRLHREILANFFSFSRWEVMSIGAHQFTFLLDGAHKCIGRTPFLVLLITSVPGDTATRNAIRQTWGDEKLVPGIDIMRLFLLGAPQPPSAFSAMQAVLQNESTAFGDIIQQDFLDTYNNLTLKTMMGMKWVANFCPNASYVMKIDSDMFFNPVFLVNQLLQPNLPLKKNYFTGDAYRWSWPIRDSDNKWYVSVEVYPKMFYPTYCSGTGYVLSGDLATKIYQVSPLVTFIHMEDVFMGLCLEALGVKVTKPPDYVFNGERIEYERCKFVKLVTVHHYPKEDLLQLWPDFMDALKTC